MPACHGGRLLQAIMPHSQSHPGDKIPRATVMFVEWTPWIRETLNFIKHVWLKQIVQIGLQSTQPDMLFGPRVSQVLLVLSQPLFGIAACIIRYTEIILSLTFCTINIPCETLEFQPIKNTFVCNCWFIITGSWGFLVRINLRLFHFVPNCQTISMMNKIWSKSREDNLSFQLLMLQLG